MGLIGGAVGGFVANILQLAGSGMSITVIPGILLYLDSQLLPYILVNVIAIATGFALTYFFGFKDEDLKEI